MPAAPDVASEETSTIRVEGSIAVELFWVLHDLSLNESRRPHPVYTNQELRDRVTRFWPEEPTPDCGPVFDEVLLGKKTAAQAVKEFKPDVDKLLKDGAAKLKA